MSLRRKLIWQVLPIFLAIVAFYQISLVTASMKSVRIEEIPFGHDENSGQLQTQTAGIHLLSKMRTQRNFLKLFHVPWKWPFVPTFMQGQVNSAAKTFFSNNDSFIKDFCQKWITIKECFRPLFSTTPTAPAFDAVEKLSAVQSTACTCTATEPATPVVFFDRDHIGRVSSETILNTIEFLESFLPAPTKKTKRKHSVRGRLDKIDID